MLPRGALGLTLALLVAGCAATLEPAPGAVRLPGPDRGAIAEAAGVRIVAAARAWRGSPASLGTVVAPMLVVIENGSSRRLGVRTSSFTLVAADGRHFAAVPPRQVSGVVSEPAGWAYYPSWGFYGHRFYSYSPFYERYPVFADVRLPTSDMIRQALPEEVVEPGGRISGFLYFEKVPRNADTVTLAAMLVDADTDAEFGTVRIPFVVD